MEMVHILDVFGFLNMEVVVGLNVAATLLEKLRTIALASQSLSHLMVRFWLLGRILTMEMVLTVDMSGFMSMEVVAIGPNVVVILMELLLTKSPHLSLSLAMVMFWLSVAILL
jgi:hypothetical protein